jgi:hypothetical protein
MLQMVMLVLVRLGSAIDTQDQKIICNGVINIPPHDFKQT